MVFKNSDYDIKVAKITKLSDGQNPWFIEVRTEGVQTLNFRLFARIGVN